MIISGTFQLVILDRGSLLALLFIYVYREETDETDILRNHEVCQKAHGTLKTTV